MAPLESHPLESHIAEKLHAYTMVFRVLDAHLGAAGGPARDWSRERLDLSLAGRARAREAQEAQAAARVAGTAPAQAMASYAGRYRQPLLGEVEVTADGDHLRVTWGALHGQAPHWHFETFRIGWAKPQWGTSLATFQVGEDGKPSRLVIEELGAFDRLP